MPLDKPFFNQELNNKTQAKKQAAEQIIIKKKEIEALENTIKRLDIEIALVKSYQEKA